MKKRYRVLGTVLVVVCIAIALSVLCGRGDKRNNEQGKEQEKQQSLKIIDVYEQFENMPLYIEIKMNNEYVGSFIIDDPDKVEEIFSMIINQDYSLYGEVLPPGSDISINFVFSEDTSISISSRYIVYSDSLYLASNSIEIDSLLVSIGLEMNAIESR